MVHAENLVDWFKLAQNISHELSARGWLRCELVPAVQHHLMVWAGQLSVMKCVRAEPYKAVVDFHAYSVVEGALQAGFCECDKGAGMEALGMLNREGCYCSGATHTA
ncbi:unnamed protein product, partial [Symbiodinium pilosum]